MRPSINKIESTANNLSLKHGGLKLPIDVNKIAEYLNIDIKKDDIGNDISGVLVIKNGKGVIGINETESRNNLRARFTIAHEIGHYMLHRFEQSIFIDHNNFKAVFYRDSKSSTGKETKEREANAFAAALLMPKDLIIKEISKRTFSFNLADNNEEIDIISKLSEKFQVSKQAMTYRLVNLQILNI